MKVLEKTERRLGEKLFIKGDRCSGPKCALVRKAYPPGLHGKTRRRASSEYGQLMKEKQKLRYLYGLDDGEIASYSKKAVEQSGLYSTVLLNMLERRLDNVVFRLGFAPSRRSARQAVGHRHIAVNGKTLNIPSYQVRKGEVITIKDRIASSVLFSGLDVRLKNYEPPKWLILDKNKKSGTVAGMPELEQGEIIVEVMKIKEFYSR